MGNWRRALFPVGMGVVILVATLSGSWWKADALLLSVRVGLREIGVCGGGHCEWQSFAGLGGSSAFKTISLLTYLLGWVAGLSLIVGGVIRALQGLSLNYLGKIQTMSCIGFGVFSILAVLTFPGFREASIGWPVAVAFVGALGGIFSVRDMGESTGWGGRPGVYVEVKPLGNTSASAAAAPSGTATPARPASSPTPASTQPPAPSELRFVCSRVEIGLRHITAHRDDGSSQELSYGSVAYLAARRLPPEADVRRMTFLDFVPKGTNDAPVVPIRLVPSTEANFEILPEGQGMTPRESFRRLGRFIQSRNPGVVFETDSEEFFAGKEAKQFIAIKQLGAFEAGYVDSAG